MPSFETLLFFFVFLLLAIVGLSLLVVLRSRSRGSIVSLLEAGEFHAALEAFRATTEPGRDDLLAAARAARHLLDLESARDALDLVLQEDPNDGEAWLERALVAACAGEFEVSRRAFSRVLVTRSDLFESLTLHRAWMELLAGNEALSGRFFDEVEASLETKLRDDLGGGDPMFADWFLHAGWLWRSRGQEEKATWALSVARTSAPESALPGMLEQD